MTRFARAGRRAGALAGTLALATAGLLAGLATPAAATTGTDQAGVRAAFADADETQIDLANDITLSDCAGAAFGEVRRVSPNTDLTLDGHGFTVTQTCATAGVFGQNGDFALTFQNVTITGGHQDNTD